MTDRLEKLRALLAKNPADAFVLYAIGIELKKIPDFPGAIEHFEKTISADANYCYAYYQLGQTCELMEDEDGAKKAYGRGIEAARRCGDAKALGELQGALDIL